MKPDEIIPPTSDVAQAATSQAYLGAVGGVLASNVLEKLAWRALPTVFGMSAVNPVTGRVTFHGLKPNPDPAKRGAEPFVRQTAESPQLGINRQIGRVILAGVGLAVGLGSKNEALKGAGFTLAATSAAHVAQDLVPVLR